MIRLRLALAAALIAAPPAAFAQPRAAAQAPVVRPWQVDWGQYYCSLIRKPEAGRPFFTAWITTPGSAGTSMRLVPQGRQEAPGDVDNILLLSAGTPISVSRSDELRERMIVRGIYGLPTDFLDALAAASELQLRAGDRIRARVPLDGVRDALAALRRCSTEVARIWGIDEAALAALSQRPSTTNMLGLHAEDYPAAAVRTATQGHVVVRIAVSTEGRATDCATVASSGSREIDATVCRVAMANGRFDPGLDAAGRPVAARALFTATFRLPQD